MNEKPEALLLLADELDDWSEGPNTWELTSKAAAELRRLHYENLDLKAAIQIYLEVIAERNQLAEEIVRDCIETVKRVGILEDIENETDMVVNAIKEKYELE